MGVTHESVWLDAQRKPSTSRRMGLATYRVENYLRNDLGGYLAGTLPDGVTRLDGAPVSATVRVSLRSPMHALDGLPIAEVVSAIDGTWRVDGLDPALRFDVVCRLEGFNDLILSNVSPVPY